MSKLAWFLGSLILVADLSADDFANLRDQNWHQWRGPRADGIAPRATPPLNWSEDRNVKWKTPIPGRGSGTPIVWKDQVFIVSALKTQRGAEKAPRQDERSKTVPPAHYYQFIVLCLQRDTGDVVWKNVACEEVPHEGRHSTNTFASGSPTTDGQRLYVSFGSRGVYAFELDGTLLWKRDLGDMRTRYGWGEASSPVVHQDHLVVNWDHEDQSFIEVLNSLNGTTRWKVDRDEPTSWATPLVVEHEGTTQIIVNGTNRVRSYELTTGKVLWECGGQSVNAIPSPVAAGDIVYCMSGYRQHAAIAIPLGSRGDVTDKKKLWSHHRGTPYVPSPIIYGEQIYFTRSNSAILSCLDVATGKPVFQQERIPGISNLYASPTAAAGRIYIVARDGTTVVINAGRRLEVLATNKLDDPLDASPAIVGKQLFLRGAENVYCIE